MPLRWERRERGSSIVTTRCGGSTASDRRGAPRPGEGTRSRGVLTLRGGPAAGGRAPPVSLPDALLGGQGRADDAGVVEQLRGDDGGAGRQQRYPLVRLLAHPAADDEEVRPDGGLQDVEVAVHPLGPLRVAEVLAVLRGGRGMLLAVVAVDLDVPELGVRDQDAVGEQRTADPRAEGQHE